MVTMRQDMEDVAEKAVQYALKLGASDCDAVACESKFNVAEIEKSSVKQASSVATFGIGVRTFVKGCAGFSSGTGMDGRSMRRVVELSVSQAEGGTSDPDFKGLPPKKRPSKVRGLFDPRIARLTSGDVVEMAIALTDSASTDPRVTSVNAGVAVGTGTASLANSEGFIASQILSSFELSAEAVAKSGTVMFSGTDGGSSRQYVPEMIDQIGASAQKSAIRGLKSTKLKTGDYPVILDPFAAGLILGAAIGGGANAESVQRGRSFLGGKLGKTIGSDMLTVVDDPTLDWCTGSYSFDGEGVPGRRNPIINEGVLRSYLHDSYTARKDSVENTGNSSRGSSQWSFRRPPSISSSNLVVSPGRSSPDEMIRETKKGVYFRVSYDHPNLATGEFSALMMESYLIERGELGDSLRQSTMGLGLVDLFSRIDMLGKESRDMFGVRTPHMRISRARIAGSA